MAEDHHDLMSRGDLEKSEFAQAEGRGFRRFAQAIRSTIEDERDRFSTSRGLARELLLHIDRMVDQAGLPKIT